MAVQKRNDEMIGLLGADFLRKKFPLVIYGNFSGFGIWELQFDNNDIATIIPVSDFVVTSCLRFRSFATTAAIVDIYTSEGFLTPNTDGALFDNGEVAVAIRVLADGSIETQRVLGTETILVRLQLDWF